MAATTKRTKSSVLNTASALPAKAGTTHHIEHLAPTSLRPWPGNARTHSKRQVKQLAGSIRVFGFTSPVLIDERGTILAGHGRVLAAMELGLEFIPCIRLSGLSEAQKRAYVLADNKLALNAGWDEGLLAQELQGLLQADLGFDLSVTGFSIPEVDSLVEGLAPQLPPGTVTLPRTPAIIQKIKKMGAPATRPPAPTVATAVFPPEWPPAHGGRWPAGFRYRAPRSE